MRQKRKPILAVTMGDPAGVGPEIIADLFARRRPSMSVAAILGSARVFDAWLRRHRARVRVIDGGSAEDLPLAGSDSLVFVDTACRDRFSRRKDSRGGGRHAGAALDLACSLARSGRIDGIVTAPISKAALALAGYRYAGHTEMLAAALDAPHCQMMMVYRGLRVVPVTRHLPVKAISRALTAELVFKALDVTHRALRDDFAVLRPRIAVAGLNPHAGEGGLIGEEETRVIQPAIARARRRGIRVEGPLAADSLFMAESGTFDAFVTMYHDQGLIPFKMRAKRRGVNVTVGLPVVRTSVDHGVAYDIAGKNLASSVSLEAAYRLAERLARRHLAR